MRPEPLDLLIIALIAVLIFGANRLPETVRAIGKAIRGFREGLAGEDESTTDDSKDTSNSQHPPA